LPCRQLNKQSIVQAVCSAVYLCQKRLSHSPLLYCPCADAGTNLSLAHARRLRQPVLQGRRRRQQPLHQALGVPGDQTLSDSELANYLARRAAAGAGDRPGETVRVDRGEEGYVHRRRGRPRRHGVLRRRLGPAGSPAHWPCGSTPPLLGSERTSTAGSSARRGRLGG